MMRLLNLLILFAILSGCYENPQTTAFHKPGVYQGKSDEMSLEKQQEIVKLYQNRQFNERFTMIQTDR